MSAILDYVYACSVLHMRANISIVNIIIHNAMRIHRSIIQHSMIHMCALHHIVSEHLEREQYICVPVVNRSMNESMHCLHACAQHHTMSEHLASERHAHMHCVCNSYISVLCDRKHILLNSYTQQVCIIQFYPHIATIHRNP